MYRLQTCSVYSCRVYPAVTMFPIMALLLIALAGPGAIAMAPPPSTFATLQDLDALQKQFGGLHASQLESREEILALRAKVEELGAQNVEQQAQIDNCGRPEGGEGRRGMQSQGPASQGEAVTMFKRPVSALMLHHSGGGDGTGHRILQAECDADMLKQHTEAVNEECCDEPGEDCSGGVPHAPNADCCGVLVPFFQACAGQMGDGIDSIREVCRCPPPPPPLSLHPQRPQSTPKLPQIPPPQVVAMCPTSAAGPAVPTSTAVLLFSAVCPPGVLLETCIPYCDETTNGDVLLLQQAGNDMRLLCEMNNYFFSWIGAPSFSNSRLVSSPRPQSYVRYRAPDAGRLVCGRRGRPRRLPGRERAGLRAGAHLGRGGGLRADADGGRAQQGGPHDPAGAGERAGWDVNRSDVYAP